MKKLILGGGLGGLSSAYYLSRVPNQHVTLIEATNRLGGWIKSAKNDDGIIMEQGPRTIRPSGVTGANTLRLVEELNLADQIVAIPQSHPTAKNRMIFAKGGLHLLPNSMSGLFTKQAPFRKPLIFYLVKDLYGGKKSVPDESIYDFIERRFGADIADYLISPLICGICAGNAKEISVKFLLKAFFEYEQQYGSISKGMLYNSFKDKTKEATTRSPLVEKSKQEHWSVYSFKEGCETLSRALAKAISQNTEVNLNTLCTEVQFEDRRVSLVFNTGVITGDHLISAVPARVLSGLVKHQHPDLATLLTNLTGSVTVGVVNLHFNGPLLKQSGFGLLVAPKENLPILGVIFDSCLFPNPANDTVLTVMLGGHSFEKHFGSNPSNEDLLQVTLQHLGEILKINETPKYSRVNVLRSCIPQYVVGHDETLTGILKYVKEKGLPLSLCGASYNGVGINDVILSAKTVVEALR